MKLNTRYDVCLLVGISFVSIKLYALPFDITPNGTLPTTYPSIASYIITKNTVKGQTGNIIKWLPRNVSIAAAGTTCATSLNAPFSLEKGNNCTLNLTVSGPVSSNDKNPDQHLMVCLSDRLTCAGPSPENSLNVSSATPASKNLTIVGNYYVNPHRLPLAYYSEDRGQTWSQSHIQEEPPSDNFMHGVACGASGLQCTAIANNAISQAKSYSSSDGGKTWTGPVQVETSLQPSMSGIFCDSATGLSCVAVGNSNASPSLATGVLTTNGGQTWGSLLTFQNTPITATGSTLNSVACDSAMTTCLAVGQYNYTGQNTNPIIYHSAGNLSIWTQYIPSPVATNKTQSLASVACSSTGEKCTAVGYYSDSIDKPSGYYTINGGASWTLSNPTLTSLEVGRLNGIACDATGSSCIAVGSYEDTAGGNTVPLIYLTSNGGETWSSPQHSLPLPSDVDHITSHAPLSSVSCDSTGLFCTAAGVYQTSTTGVHQPLTYYTVNGGQTWNLSLPPAFSILTTLDITGVA